MSPPPIRYLLLAAIVVAGCGSDPKRLRFTTESPDAVLAQLQARRGLSVEETRLLYAHLARTQVERIEGTGPPLAGRTVGEVIAEEKAYAAEHATAIAEAQTDAASWKQRYERAIAEMNEALRVSVVEKRDPEEPPAGTVHSRTVIVRLKIANATRQQVVGAEGALIFKDVYGRDLFEGSVNLREPIEAGASVDRLEYVVCSPSFGRESVVRHFRIADARVSWEPRAIRFDDGAVLTTPDE